MRFIKNLFSFANVSKLSGKEYRSYFGSVVGHSVDSAYRNINAKNKILQAIKKEAIAAKAILVAHTGKNANIYYIFSVDNVNGRKMVTYTNMSTGKGVRHTTNANNLMTRGVYVAVVLPTGETIDLSSSKEIQNLIKG